MASTVRQRNGMRGVFLVAAELAGRGMIVTTTSRNAMGADLLVADGSCSRTFSVQVKTNAKPAASWLVDANAEKRASPSHVYVLVNVRGTGEHEYFVVPSAEIARHVRIDKRPKGPWYSVRAADIARYQNAWQELGVGLEPT